jgi:hypothetical protein
MFSKGGKSTVAVLAGLVLTGAVAAAGCTIEINGAEIGRETVEGSGRLASEERDVESFDTVELSGQGRLTIVQGDQESLVVTTDDNLLEYLTTEQTGGTLRVRVFDGDRVNHGPSRMPELELTVTDLAAVRTSGSFEVVGDRLRTPDLAIESSGSCLVSLDDLRTDSLRVRISGSGEFDLAGSADRQDVEISGSGLYRAAGLRTRESDLTLSGSARAQVWVTEYLDARLSGLGEVEYWGDPEVTGDDDHLVPLGSK